MSTLRLGTRGSALALVQSKAVAAALSVAHPGLNVELVILKSGGDQKPDAPLSQVGGQGLFTAELESALQRGEIDLAVHSLKDLPTQLAAGLLLAAVTEREDWRDAWLSASYASPWELPQGATVGTGSPRRRAQLLARRPDLQFVEFRGNVDTRLRKLEDGQVDGAVLALAGLKRLGLQDKARLLFSEDEMLPAPGQGFVAVETQDKGEARRLCAALNSPLDFAEASCERALLAKLGAGCQAPVGALARTMGQRMSLRAYMASGSEGFNLADEGPVADPVALGWQLAEKGLSLMKK